MLKPGLYRNISVNYIGLYGSIAVRPGKFVLILANTQRSEQYIAVNSDGKLGEFFTGQEKDLELVKR